LRFENYGQEVGKTNTLLVPQPKSWVTSLPGPYGCCACEVGEADKCHIVENISQNGRTHLRCSVALSQNYESVSMSLCGASLVVCHRQDATIENTLVK